MPRSLSQGPRDGRRPRDFDRHLKWLCGARWQAAFPPKHRPPAGYALPTKQARTGRAYKGPHISPYLQKAHSGPKPGHEIAEKNFFFGEAPILHGFVFNISSVGMECGAA